MNAARRTEQKHLRINLARLACISALYPFYHCFTHTRTAHIISPATALIQTTEYRVPITRRSPSILYFVISHPSCVAEEVAARTTWAKDLNVLWFNTEKSFRDTIVVSVVPNSYMNIFPRVRKVWQHIYENERSKYDWYVRLFPDNYLFASRLERLLMPLDPALPQIIGHVASTKHGAFVGGGAGWIVSRSALEAWALTDGADFSKCEIPSWLESDQIYAEDVIISDCMQRAGINFVQQKDLFRSFYPGHESNSDVSEDQIILGAPKNIITLHYMTAGQVTALWRKEIRSRKYAVISFTDDKKGVDYAYLAPFAVAAWKRIGWSSIVVHVKTQQQDVSIAMTTLQNAVSALDPTALFLTIPTRTENAATVAQLVRLFIASLDHIADDDVLLTSDADILPISRKAYELDPVDVMNVLNADCCGSINVGAHKVLMQPMTNVIGTKRNWRKLMELSLVQDLSHLDMQKWLSDHKFEQFPNSSVIKGENDLWYMDQRILSLRLHHSPVPVKKIPRKTSEDRVDRIYAETWPSRISLADLEQKTDLHAWLPSSRGEGHDELMHFVHACFDTFDVSILNDFHTNFTELI